MKRRIDNTFSACPFIDSGDRRCATKLSLGSLDEAFDVCFGDYQSCQVYQLLLQAKPIAPNMQVNFQDDFAQEAKELALV